MSVFRKTYAAPVVLVELPNRTKLESPWSIVNNVKTVNRGYATNHGYTSVVLGHHEMVLERLLQKLYTINVILNPMETPDLQTRPQIEQRTQ